MSVGQEATKIQDVARTTDSLKELKLPVGWSEPVFDDSHTVGWWASHIVGWVLTGALLMLGAPFWFDLLSRLVSLRNAGKPPENAPKDTASASAAVIRAKATPSRSAAAAPLAQAGFREFLGAVPAPSTLPALGSPPSGTAGAVVRRLAGR